MSSVKAALKNLIDESTALTPNGHFEIDTDLDWNSDCIIKSEHGISTWKPIEQSIPVNFSGLANAVEAPIHADAIEYFSSFWSSSIQGKTKEGPLSLIQLWNPEDFERLIENLIGHLIAKSNVKLPFTLFFATADPDSELFLSIENDTGRILLEEPGSPPIKEVDSNLTDFLKRVSPDNAAPEIY
jgi:SecY interacting protein Syd